MLFLICLSGDNMGSALASSGGRGAGPCCRPMYHSGLWAAATGMGGSSPTAVLTGPDFQRSLESPGGSSVQWVEWWFQKDRSSPPRPVNRTLFGRRVLAGVVKELEMRSSWVAWVGSNTTDRCPCKRHSEERDTWTGEEKATSGRRQRLG